MKNKKNHFAWIVLLGVILIRGFAGGGLNAAAGLFLSPVSESLGVGIGQLSIYLSISSVAMMLSLPILGKLVNKYDIKILAIIGGLMHAGSFIGFGFLKSVWGWYILAIPNAIGSTLLINILGPVLINRWFVKNTGTILGISLAVVGLFGAIIQPVTTSIIAASGWESGYITLGTIALIVILLALIFFVKSSPKDMNIEPFGYERTMSSKQTSDNILLEGMEAKVATKSKQFKCLVAFTIGIGSAAVFMQHITPYGVQLEYSLKSIGMAVSLASLGTAFGSIAIGYLSDKFSVVKVSVAILSNGIIAIILFLLAKESFGLFLLASFMNGITTATIAVLPPLLVINFFGKKDYEIIFTKLMVGLPLASIFLVPLYGFIFDTFEDYKLVLILILLMLIGSLMNLLLACKKSAN